MIKVQGMIKARQYQNDHVRKRDARLIRRPREFSLIIAQAPPGVHDTHHSEWSARKFVSTNRDFIGGRKSH